MLTQISSVEPPPMSKTSAEAQAIEKRRTASDRKTRLVLVRDDFESETGFGFNACDEIRAVGGDAAGFGGDKAGARDAAPGHLVGANLQRLDRPVHRIIAQGAAGREALAKADDAGIGVHDLEALAGAPGDQETAIVGAKIERAIDGAGLGVALRACTVRRLIFLGAGLSALCLPALAARTAAATPGAGHRLSRAGLTCRRAGRQRTGIGYGGLRRPFRTHVTFWVHGRPRPGKQRDTP
jgi:hypothetical protein